MTVTMRMLDYVDNITKTPPPLGAELQAALDLIPTHTWYVIPSGGLTFLNQRCSDYLGLPQDHPLRLGMIKSSAESDKILPKHTRNLSLSN